MQLDLQVVVSDPELPAAKDFEQWTDAALSIAEHPGGELTLRVVSEEEMSSFNLRFCGHHGSTNVLSFPFEMPPGIPLELLGDLIICVGVVEQEAKEQEKTTEAHWAHMVIHGCLHLLGYDHIKDDEAEEMEALERDLLASLGYPDPYAADTE